MAEEVSAFLWSEGLNDPTDLPHQAWNSVLGGLAQMGLQFGFIARTSGRFPANFDLLTFYGF
jgi:hypothetical protein